MSNDTCTVADCEVRIYARNYCTSHYRRFMKTGRATKKTLRERFEEKTETQGDCIVWTKARNPDGYGVFFAEGKMKFAHRIAWGLAGFEVPEGFVLDHECRNPPCVNVDHLRPVTNKQNGENRSGAQKCNSSSGIRGVTWHRRNKKWQVSVGHNGKLHHGGQFADLSEAEVAAVSLRNELFTHNDADRVAPILGVVASSPAHGTLTSG